MGLNLSTESVECNVNGLYQTDIRICLKDKSFCLWDLLWDLLNEKSEDNIPIVGFESHKYPFMGDYFPFVGECFPFVGGYFPFMGDYFPLKGNILP